MLDTEIRIPEISNRRLRALAHRIKPVIRIISANEEVDWHFITSVKDPRETNLAGQPAATNRALNLQLMAVMTTFHRHREHRSHATLAEVLAQIPKAWLERAVGFELTKLMPIEGRTSRSETILFEEA